jgi:uncharacterized membrane protein YjdF
MASLIRELWMHVRVRKQWWLARIILVIMLMRALLVLAQRSALAPFIYTIL